uniref:S8 family serine peptidase n=1 Tax=Deinococcus oregonensis TaxID=1805970 RepID=A0ABV6B3T9_9DEIO
MNHTARISLLALLLSACAGPPSPGPNPGTRPTITRFTAMPAALTAPGSVTLAWEVSGATTLEIDGGVGSVTPPSTGSRNVNLAATTTYTLTARNAAGSATAKVTASLNARPFSYRIDPSVRPFTDSVTGWGGPRPVVAVRDAAGLTSAFVANELIALPGSQADLDALLTRTGAAVLNSYTEGTERTVLLRLDPGAVSLDSFTADANALGAPGESVFSSEEAARLLALVARETVGGLKVSANFLDQPQGVLLNTQEGGAVSGTADAFSRPEFSNTASKPQVVQAWQFVAAHGLSAPSRRVRVAIIDGGFWLNPDGTSLPDANGQGDLPPLPIQANFIGEGNASGLNPADCGEGNPCPYHGHGSASVAVGTLNNGAHAAGTGGQVADPMLLRSDLSTYSVKHAIDWARGQGADVINMSFGGECGWWCHGGKDLAGYYDAFDRAHDAGIFLVASAGNGGKDKLGDDVEDESYEPCIISGVFCVGALGSPGQAYTNSAKPYSNYGGPVNLWAPTDIMAMPDGVSGGQSVIHNGTSASAPYVAGVAAMMKAMNPALNYGQMRDILQDTAWTDSPDPRVTRYLNAFEAVKKAADFRLPPDRFEANDAPASATVLTPAQHDDLTIHAGSDVDRYRFTTTGPTEATLNFRHADGVGKVGFANYGLNKVVGCGDPIELANASVLNGRQVKYRLPAGDFSFVLAGGQPMPYDLGLSVNSRSILPDKYEFNAANVQTGNDTRTQASFIGDGGYLSSSLHVNTDVDFYTFYSRGNTNNITGEMKSLARVEGADGPLILRAFTSDGTLVGLDASSGDCADQARLVVPQGFITVAVSGSAAGEYSLWLGSTGEQHPVLSVKQLIYLILHPNVPVELTLREPIEHFLINKVSDLGLSSVELRGAGLHLTLYSEAGSLIAEGESFQGGAGERIELAQALPEQRYVLRVARTLEGEADSGGSIPVPVKATLNIQTGR